MRDTVIDIRKMVEETTAISETIKAIVILHFNPAHNSFYYKDSHFEFEPIEFDKYKLFKLNYTGEEEIKTEIYIFDHRYESTRPITVLSYNQKPSEENLILGMTEYIKDLSVFIAVTLAIITLGFLILWVIIIRRRRRDDSSMGSQEQVGTGKFSEFSDNA